MNSCDCGPILKTLSAGQLSQLKNHIISTANKRSIDLGVKMEATHTHEVTPLVNTTEMAPETVAPVEAAKPAEVVAEPAKTEEVKVEEVKVEEVEQVEMVAVSEKKAVEDQLAAKTAEFTALSSANAELKTELEALQAKSSTDIAEAVKAAKDAANTEIAGLNEKIQAESSKVAEYKAALEAAIPQEKLSEAVLKAASGIVEGYDATKKVAEQTPATIVKLLKFSDTIAQSTNAGAVETSAKKPKNPNISLVFPGITIKKKKQE